MDKGISHLHECDEDEDGNILRKRKRKRKANYEDSEEFSSIKGSIFRHNCEIIAIGNGTASRETQELFSEQIQRGAFSPLKVQFV